MASVELRVGQDPAHFRLVRLVSAAVGRLAGLGEETLHEVRLGVTEACGLAMDSLDAEGIGDPVSLEFHDDDGLRVVVRSAAGVLDPAMAVRAGADPGPGSAGEWSQGTYAVDRVALIEGLIDDVDIESRPGGSVITMRWTHDHA